MSDGDDDDDAYHMASNDVYHISFLLPGLLLSERPAGGDARGGKKGSLEQLRNQRIKKRHPNPGSVINGWSMSLFCTHNSFYMPVHRETMRAMILIAFPHPSNVLRRPKAKIEEL